jgi:hypothetical protein
VALVPVLRPDRSPRQHVFGAAYHLGLRLWVHCFHWQLDAKLAEGFDAASERALAVRAAQLLSTRHRRRLAASVERVVREADAKPKPSFSVVIGTARDQVAEARSSLLFLAYLLRHAEQVGPRGVAIIERLMTDGGSPVYVKSFRGALALRVQTALDRLVGPDMAFPEAWLSSSAADRQELVGSP